MARGGKKSHLRLPTSAATEVTVSSVSLSVTLTFLGAARPSTSTPHHSFSPLRSSLLSPCHAIADLSRQCRKGSNTVYQSIPRSSVSVPPSTILKKKTSFGHLLTSLLSVRFLFLASTYFAPKNGRFHIRIPTSSRETATGSGSESECSSCRIHGPTSSLEAAGGCKCRVRVVLRQSLFRMHDIC
jgi:hypothetical protein